MKKRGISLLILAITIIVMAILITATITGVNLATNDARLTTFSTEISEIERSIKEEYTLTGVMPVEAVPLTRDEVLALVGTDKRADLLAEMTQNKDLEETFYKIDLAKLGAVRTKRGVEKDQEDIYVVTGESARVYYVAGIKVGNKRYFSLTKNLSGLTKVESEAEEEVLNITEKLTVVKRQKTWTNKLFLGVTTALSGTQKVKIEFPDGVEGDITESIKTGDIEISPNTCGTHLNGVNTLVIKKYSSDDASAEILDRVEVNITNLDYLAPTFTDDTIEIDMGASNSTITYKGSDDKSGFGEMYYYVVSNKVDGEIIEVSDVSSKQEVNATGEARKEIQEYLKMYSKVSKSQTVKLPPETYHIRIMIADKAGNITDYKEYVLDKTAAVNPPVLVNGMIPAVWDGSRFVETSAADENWYNYSVEERKWANAITKDSNGNVTGYFVWIPRYAYKVSDTYSPESDANSAKAFDIKFLMGTTEKVYNIASKSLENLPSGYVVHPAFTNGSSTNYANGEWDSEIKGFWVPKFEAGFPSKGNSVPVTRSNLKPTLSYTINGETFQSEYIVNHSEMKDYGEYKMSWFGGEVKTEDLTMYMSSTLNYRNCIDGRKNQNWNNTIPNLIYPVFLPNTTAYNYIATTDSYALAKALTDSGNPYGFSKIDADSHLMKNSEWGAVAYLSQSKYGVYLDRIVPNFSNLQKETFKAYSEYSITAGGNSNSSTDNNNYAASGEVAMVNNVLQSTTQNVYGIYDLSGGLHESVAAFIANGSKYLYGYSGRLSLNDNGTPRTTSTKYVTIYPHNSGDDGGTDNIGEYLSQIFTDQANKNIATNTHIYGDAMRETSYPNGYGFIATERSNSWFSQSSAYPVYSYPVIKRGGKTDDSTPASTNKNACGLFSYARSRGKAAYECTFRSVIIPK